MQGDAVQALAPTACTSVKLKDMQCKVNDMQFAQLVRIVLNILLAGALPSAVQ